MSQKLTKTKLKTRTIGVIKNRKLVITLVIIGVLTLIGDSAPYIHLAFPKKAKELIVLEKKYDNRQIDKATYQQQRKVLKQKYQTFGFTNTRRFLFAIGLAISLFCVASLFLISQFLAANLILERAFKISALSFLLNGTYYNIWVFWDNPDLPNVAYHTIILTIAILITIVLYYLYQHFAKTKATKQVLQGNLKTLDRDLKVIQELGQLMPENENFMTYKVMIDVTSEDLKTTRSKIDNQLN